MDRNVLMTEENTRRSLNLKFCSLSGTACYMKQTVGASISGGGLLGASFIGYASSLSASTFSSVSSVSSSIPASTSSTALVSSKASSGSSSSSSDVCGVVYTVKPGTPATSKAIVALTMLYIVNYNGLIATYVWLTGGESPSQRLRSYTFGLASSVGFFGAWLATFTVPYFLNPESLDWGSKYGYIWFPSCLIAATFMYFYLPDIKDRTLEEITEMFEARLPARKFAGYKCVGNASALEAKGKKMEVEDEVSTTEVVFSNPKAVTEQAISVS